MAQLYNGDLEIETDIAHQRKTWRYKRIGWVIMSIILLSVLIGFTGGGPLSTKKISSGTTNIEYESITRYKRITPLKIHLNTQMVSAADSTVKISINRVFLDRMEIDCIIPEPESSEVATDAVIFNFKVAEFDPENFIVFYFNPDYIGSTSLIVKAGNEQPYDLSQFIYP